MDRRWQSSARDQTTARRRPVQLYVLCHTNSRRVIAVTWRCVESCAEPRLEGGSNLGTPEDLYEMNELSIDCGTYLDCQ